MRTIAFSLVLGLGVLVGMTANAQDFVLSISSDTAMPGEQVTLSNTFDNNSVGISIQGYGWGNCIGDSSIIEIVSTAEGPNSRGSFGSGVAFSAPTVIPGQGWTLGVITDFGGMNVIQGGVVDSVLWLATYDVLAEGVSSVDYCNTLGSPAVETNIADTNSSSQPTTLVGGTVTGELPPPAVLNFSYTAGSATVGYDPSNGIASVTVNLDTLEDSTNDNFPNATSGFSMGLSHDPAVVQATNIDLGPLDVALGAPAAFTGPMILTNGITIGSIFDFSAMNSITFDTTKTVAAVTYSAVGLAGNNTGVSTDLVWIDTLGSPEVENTVVVGIAPAPVLFANGTLTFSPVVEQPFIRGNCNDDGTVNIADGIFILNTLFQGGPAGPCFEACDANNDGSITMTDAMFVITYRLLGGAAPSAPFPNCGIEIGADCGSSAFCP